MHIAIIGAYGSAGIASARRLSDNIGDEIDKVTLIDSGEPGGLCILRGCMPSKAVLSSAKHVHSANSDPRVGSHSYIDVQKTVEHKDRHISSFAEHRGDSVQKLAQMSGVELIKEKARFENENKLVLSNGREIEPDYTVVATGSKLNVPNLEGLHEIDYLTSADILDMKELPDSVVVMGFGAIGIEMSAYLSTAGVDVTVVEHDNSPLDVASDEIGEELMQIYEEEFDIEIVNNTYEDSVRRVDGKLRVYTDSDEQEYLEAEELCLFTGRNPNTDGLGLENIGVDSTENWVDDSQLVRGTDSVFAAGDVTGDRMILHIAKEQGFLASDNIINSIKDRDLERFLSTEHLVYFAGNGKYPFSKYGVSADEAEDEDNLIVVRRNASDDGIFKLKDAEYGLATLVVESDTGYVRGYEGLHLNSDVMVKTIQVLIENDIDVRDVPDRAYHPTTPEILDGLFRDATSKLDND